MKTAAGVTSQEYAAMAAFRHALRRFLRFSREYLAEIGLTPEQYEVLLTLKANGAKKGLTVGELSEQVQVKHHSAVSLVDKLAAQGFVSRAQSDEDRRRVYVSLTEKGEEMIVRAAAAHRPQIRAHSKDMLTALRVLQK